MNTSELVSAVGTLCLELNGKDGGTRVVRELITRCKQIRALNHNSSSSLYRRVRASQLWLQGIPQAGGMYDPQLFLDSIPEPTPQMLERHEREQSSTSYLILVVPTVSVATLCYWLGIPINSLILSHHSEFRGRLKGPYWLRIREYLPTNSWLATEQTLYPARVTLHDALCLYAQEDPFSSGNTIVLPGSKTSDQTELLCFNRHSPEDMQVEFTPLSASYPALYGFH